MKDNIFQRETFFDPDKYVYHYTHSETALEFILPSMAIRFNPFKHVNDPRESKVWDFKFKESGFEKLMESMILPKKASDYAKNTTLMFCCSRDDQDLKAGDRDYWLRRGFCLSRMWAQYGGNHTGVCLVFDKKLFQETVINQIGSNRVYHGYVIYSNLPPTIKATKDLSFPFILSHSEIEEFGLEAVVDKHLHRFHREIFFHKHLNWRDEFEYRWVIRNSSGDPIEINVGDSLKAVILGLDCSKVFLSSFCDLCCKQGVGVYCSLWSNGIFAVTDECNRLE